MNPVDLDQGVTAVTSAGTAVRLSDTSNVVRSLEIHARKNTTTANTGNVYVGVEGGSGKQYRVLTPGDPLSLSVQGEDEGIDLQGIWIDAATSGDAVTWTAIR